ncbi:MAG: hypothetical protein JNM18_15115 [Planctomycetaceae bacterium]|nr:hypothetical protein [Planctomycetaceae bacterium]
MVEFVNTVAYHKAHPEESLARYAQRKHRELANSIRGMKKVYLDTKYWIMLRDARMGRGTEPASRLLTLLSSLAADRKAVCPISIATYMEIQKQADVHTRTATAQLVDELSSGVSIVEENERVRLEVAHWLLTMSSSVDQVDELKYLPWTKVPYVLGFVFPTIPDVDPHFELAIQKSFLDQMWVIGLVDWVKGRPADYFEHPARQFDVSAINQGKTAHLDEHKDFKSLLLAEIAGVLDSFREACALALKDNWLRASGNKEDCEVDADAMNESGRRVSNLIHSAFTYDRITTAVPTIRVFASLHAAMRWDRGRVFKPNDILDIHHAVAAIPYCDYFLTERSLCHLVRSGNLAFENLFDCKVFSEADKAIESFALLAGQLNHR